MRTKLEVNSWNDVRPDQVVPLMEHLYWFRFVPKKTRRLIADQGGAHSIKGQIFNTIGTIDGLLTKLFMAFGSDMGSYRDIAERTARLFCALIADYIEPATGLKPAENTYDQLKPYISAFKRGFHDEDDQKRLRLLEVGLPQFAKINWFFLPELRRAYQKIITLWTNDEINGTRTRAWYTRMAIFSKTRILGHVPEARSAWEDDCYLDKLGQPSAETPTEILSLIMAAALQNMQYHDIPLGGCSNLLNSESTGDEVEKDRRDVDAPLKFTSDERFTIRQGGKGESARTQIEWARSSKVRIPVRNLKTGVITSHFEAPNEGEPGYKRANFWISIEMTLQALAERGSEYRPEKNPIRWDSERIERVFNATYVRVTEAGKNRRLSKTSFEVNCAMSPGSRMLATQLAKAPPHTSGMIGSGHAWRLEQSLSVSEPSAAFMFEDDLALRSTIRGGFLDWAEATDEEEKDICVSTIAAAHSYTNFPPWYGEISRAVLAEPISIKKMKVVRFEADGEPFVVTTKRESTIRRGTMMGMQNCKNSLHLLHFAEEQISMHFLHRRLLTRVVSKGFGNYLVANLAPFVRAPPTTIQACAL